MSMTSGTKMANTIIFLLLFILERPLRSAAQSVFAKNVTYDSAVITWEDITVDGATIELFQVNCQSCPSFEDVPGNTTSVVLRELKDNTPFRVCVTPFTGTGFGTEECVRFRTHLSPRTVGALSVGLFLVVSFFVLLALDLLCRRHQIEVEDAKRDELLEQGWQTFKRSSTGRVARKMARASSPPLARASSPPMARAASPRLARASAPPLNLSQDNFFDNIGDVTFEEDLPE